jgi:hypothetical protein
MKSIITNSAGILIMIAGSAFADTGASTAENGWLWMLFLGFAAVIVVFQLVPSVILFSSMLRGIFSAPINADPAATEATGTKES